MTNNSPSTRPYLPVPCDIIENLPQENRSKLIELEGFNIDPEIFIELNESIQTEIFILLSIESIVNILKRLESDNALKILEKVKNSFKNNQNTTHIYDCDTNISKAENIAKIFVNNWMSIKLIAEENNIKFIPVLQPTIFTSTSNKDYLSSETKSFRKEQYEILYELIKKELNKRNFEYLNLENSLNKEENYFIDFCHLSPDGNMEIAREIVTSKFFKN